MRKVIESWLANPSGRYQDGLAIFSQLAPEDIKKKYLVFFQEVETESGPFDPHLTILVNKVSAILNKLKVNPDAFKNIEFVFKTKELDSDTQAIIDAKNAKIDELKLKLTTLKSENEELISENSELGESIDELESDLSSAEESIEDYESQIATLETEIEELKAKRGLQIVALKDMPEDIRKKYERIQQITPLMGKLHSEISVEGLHHKTREKLVKHLLDLDDERRQNWDDIESWSEGRKTEDFSVETPAYDTDPTIAGAQMARRIERIKENMARSQSVADTTDKETIKANALKRIEGYKLELEDLIAKTQPAPAVTTETENSKGADE